MRARRAAALVTVLLGAVAATMLAAGPALAGFTERITNYRSEVTIERNGTIEVHETIAYDFGVVPHHGIYRDIPVRTEQSGKDGYDRVFPLTVTVGQWVGGYAGAIHRRRRRRQPTHQDRRSRPDDHRRAHLRHHVPRTRRDERLPRPRRARVERDRDRVVRAHRARQRRRARAGHDPARRVRDGQLRLHAAVQRRRQCGERCGVRGHAARLRTRA